MINFILQFNLSIYAIIVLLYIKSQIDYQSI